MYPYRNSKVDCLMGTGTWYTVVNRAVIKGEFFYKGRLTNTKSDAKSGHPPKEQKGVAPFHLQTRSFLLSFQKKLDVAVAATAICRTP